MLEPVDPKENADALPESVFVDPNLNPDEEFGFVSSTLGGCGGASETEGSLACSDSLVSSGGPLEDPINSMGESGRAAVDAAAPVAAKQSGSVS